MFCRNCGAQTDPDAQYCIRCGANLRMEGATTESQIPPETAAPPPPPFPPGVAEPKQKLVAALLGILLGWLGVHRFYLGFNTIGAIQLALGLLGIFTCGVTTLAAAIWGIVDGVMILTGSISTDAYGVPLRD